MNYVMTSATIGGSCPPSLHVALSLASLYPTLSTNSLAFRFEDEQHVILLPINGHILRFSSPGPLTLQRNETLMLLLIVTIQQPRCITLDKAFEPCNQTTSPGFRRKGSCFEINRTSVQQRVRKEGHVSLP